MKKVDIYVATDKEIKKTMKRLLALVVYHGSNGQDATMQIVQKAYTSKGGAACLATASALEKLTESCAVTVHFPDYHMPEVCTINQWMPIWTTNDGLRRNGKELAPERLALVKASIPHEVKATSERGEYGAWIETELKRTDKKWSILEGWEEPVIQQNLEL